MYTISTEGTQDTDLGDIFHYNLAASYRLFGGGAAMDAIIEANGEWKQRQRIAGSVDEDSGGSAIFISPGLRLIFGQKWSLYGTVSIPVHQDLNGIQDETNLKALVGVSAVF